MKNDADSRPQIAGVIVTHANLAAALREAAGSVAGDTSGITIVSNEGLNAEQLAPRVLQAVEALHGADCVVFVDFRGGSCATACVASVAALPNVRVVSGVNLPMLLDFVLRRGDHDLDALVDRLLQRGRSAVQVLKGID